MDKRQSVIAGMFAKIANRYDLANRLMTGGLDVYWRFKLVKALRGRHLSRVGDFATGSGDVAFSLAKHLQVDPSQKLEVIGIDFCEPMLNKAREKLAQKKLPKNISIDFRWGDCLHPPFEAESLDAVSLSFGLRNFEDRVAGLQAIHRVLNTGGRLVILEGSVPSRWFQPIYRFYVHRFMPWVAQWVAGDRQAYAYLGDSIAAFPPPEALKKELLAVGFKAVSYERLMFGVATLYSVDK